MGRSPSWEEAGIRTDPSHRRGARAGRSLARLALALALALVGGAPLRAQANPFRDVPGDHWSVGAVRDLAQEGLIEGFPDGTFKGKKVVTRYDMAIHLAKMLARVDRLRAAGRPGLTPEDAVTVTRLTNEYKQELDLLGVRVDALEDRVGVVERATQKLEKDLSNVRVEGFYRVEATFVDEPYDFTNYPFQLSRNPYSDFTRNGLLPVRQEVFLRFLGNPYGLDGLDKSVETFVELKGILTGVRESRLEYRFSDPPIAGDNLDDFATGVVDERRVSVNRAHMELTSKRLKLRLFSEEAITNFTGPAALLTEESLSALVFGDFSPEQGVEASGRYKKLTYDASVLKDFDVTNAAGNNPADLYEEFEPDSVTDQDVFGLRLSYETHAEDAEAKNRLIFGSSYVEHVQGYEEEDDFNRVIGFDAVWEHRTEDTEADASIVLLNSEGPGDQQDTGAIIDGTWDHDRWTVIGKYYRFGYDYRANLAELPWVDTSINRNFRHPGGFTTRTRGERLLRGQVNYRADDTLLRTVEDLVLQGLYEEKWWEEDPDDTQPDFAGNRAKRAYIQAIMDLTDRTHIEARTEYRKDVLEGEKGELIHTLNVDLTLFGETTVVGDLEFNDDYDSVNEEGDSFSRRRGQIQVNSRVSDELFLKGYAELIKNEDRSFLRGATNQDGLDVNRVGGELNYSLDDDFAFKFFGERETIEDLRNPRDDGVFDRFAGEVDFNFTRALQLRYVRGIQDLDFILADDDFLINNFAQLRYQPTEATEVLLTYGFEYEAGGRPSDRGPLVFDRTNKIIQLTAQTDF